MVYPLPLMVPAWWSKTGGANMQKANSHSCFVPPCCSFVLGYFLLIHSTFDPRTQPTCSLSLFRDSTSSNKSNTAPRPANTPQEVSYAALSYACTDSQAITRSYPAPLIRELNPSATCPCSVRACYGGLPTFGPTLLLSSYTAISIHI